MAGPSPNTLDSRTWLGLAVLGSVWGSSFFFFEIALNDLGPVTVAFLRVTLAALALGATLPILGIKLPREMRFWAAVAVIGIFNNAIPFTLIAWAQTGIESGVAAILNATTPIFSLIVAVFAVRQEVLSANHVYGLVLGFAGVLVMVGPDALLGSTVAGQFLVLAAAGSYALSAVFARRFLTSRSVLAVSFGQVSMAALALMPLSLLLEQPWTAAPTAATWGAIAAIGVFGTALAYPLYFVLLRRAGATNLMLVTLINPVVAVVLGVGVLGESPAWTSFAGMALILASLSAIDGRLAGRLRRAS